MPGPVGAPIWQERPRHRPGARRIKSNAARASSNPGVAVNESRNGHRSYHHPSNHQAPCRPNPVAPVLTALGNKKARRPARSCSVCSSARSGRPRHRVRMVFLFQITGRGHVVEACCTELRVRSPITGSDLSLGPDVRHVPSSSCRCPASEKLLGERPPSESDFHGPTHPMRLIDAPAERAVLGLLPARGVNRRARRCRRSVSLSQCGRAQRASVE